MLSQQVKVILALIATILFAIFIFGLSHSMAPVRNYRNSGSGHGLL